MTTNLKIFFNMIVCYMFFNPVIASNENDTRTKIDKVRSDLPSPMDLQVYLTALERLIDFTSNQKMYMSVNSAIGLSVLNVNLRPFLKDDVLPVALQDQLSNLIMQSDKVLHYYFHFKLPKTLHNKMVGALFNNKTAWSKGILKLNLGLLKETYSYSPKYSTWNQYLQAVRDVANATPNIDLSDRCILSLEDVEENPWSSKDFPSQCQIPVECYKAIIFGNNFGYGLTHRFLLLLLARLSRGCAIFSFEQDALIRNTLCKTMYSEAEYIAANGFDLADLMLEQMALCSLDGHAQFLRRSWLTHFLRYQTPWGCFNIILPTSPTQHFYWTNWSRDILDDECNEHITSVAAGALGAAIRFILENY